MVNETEPAKLLLPYLQRADELQKHEPLVAYYCRLYAMERGLKIPAKERTKTTSALLVSLMNQLEKDRKSLTLGPEDNLHVEGFALNVFAKADKQDRAGRADLNTAKTFYAASIFFEILNQFGEVQPGIEQKQKYAVWKAADIRKAIKEGRRPEPGPPGGDQDPSVPVNSSWEGDSSPEQLSKEKPQALQPKVSLVSAPDGGAQSEPSGQFPRNHQRYSADNIEPSPSFRSPDYDMMGSHIQPPQVFSQYSQNSHISSWERDSSPEQLSQEKSQAFQPKVSLMSATDGGTQSEPSGQLPRNIQHYSADKTEPPPSFRSPDYDMVGSHLQPPQDFPQYSQSSQAAYPSSYYAMPTTPQDAHGAQLGAGYPYSMTTPSHDTMNTSQPYNSKYEPYPRMHDGTLDSQSLSHSSYPSNAQYYQNINGNHPNTALYHVNPSSNQEFNSNMQYNSGDSRTGAHVESTPLERTTSAPEATLPTAYSYDSSYQPPPEKIAEAHKAARFAVGALAFDDVLTAVEHLKRSLELLTLPSTSL